MATVLTRAGVAPALRAAGRAAALGPPPALGSAAASANPVQSPGAAEPSGDGARPPSQGPITHRSFAFPRGRASAAAPPMPSSPPLLSSASLLSLSRSQSPKLGFAAPGATRTLAAARRRSGDDPTEAEILAAEDYAHDDPFEDVDDGGPLSSSSFANYAEDFSKMSNEELDDPSTIPGWHLIHSPPRKFPKGALVGEVVSDKMQKTVNVAVDRYRIVPKYRKRVRYTRKFMAHDEKEVCRMGDIVMITPCHRISRHKHFIVREVIRAKGVL